MNRRKPLYAQFSQEQRKRDQQKRQPSQHSQAQSQAQSQSQAPSQEGINHLLRARAAQLERERLQNTTLYNTPPRRYSIGPLTPESPPFLHAPPNTPHTPPHRQARVHSHDSSAIHTLTPSSRGGHGHGDGDRGGDVGWSWMSWAGVAFMVVLGVVLLGKQEDDDGSDYPGEATRMGEEILRKGGSSSWGFGGLRRIAVWVLWGVLAWGCWWVGCILYEAVVEAIREREREVFIVDGRRRAAGGRELDMRSRGRDSGRSGWRIVDEDSEDEYLDGHRRYESEMGESR